MAARTLIEYIDLSENEKKALAQIEAFYMSRVASSLIMASRAARERVDTSNRPTIEEADLMVDLGRKYNRWKSVCTPKQLQAVIGMLDGHTAAQIEHDAHAKHGSAKKLVKQALATYLNPPQPQTVAEGKKEEYIRQRSTQAPASLTGSRAFLRCKV